MHMHLDNSPDLFPEGHAAMLSRFPELGTTRLEQYKDRANTAGRCLRDIALETSLILTNIPSNLSHALSCLRLSGHNFLVQRMRHDRNRRPYELRICDKCDWHTIQDEEHILLDCPHEHLVRLRTQQQLIFPPQFEDGPARLRTFMNQPDIFGVASFVAKCLALFP